VSPPVRGLGVFAHCSDPPIASLSPPLKGELAKGDLIYIIVILFYHEKKDVQKTYIFRGRYKEEMIDM